MSELIEKISVQLKDRHPNIEFIRRTKDELTILSHDENGFEIIIQKGDKENIIYFGNWHIHINNDSDGENELLKYLEFGMSKLGRLKTFSRNGKEYKWIFEIKNDEDGNWYSAGTMGLLNIQFWQKPSIKYYQNNLIIFEEQTDNK